ncbi:MAG: hypothetical protein HC822_08805 [Oscillochloris sp.]|nr:hypothetical protein [Oscillochloris sp.]
MSTTTAEQQHGHGDSGPSPEDMERSVATGHQVTDIAVRPLVISGIGLFILIVVSIGLVIALLLVAGSSGVDMSNTLSEAEALELQLPPEPRLEQNPLIDGTRIENEAFERLEGYGWIDEAAGTAHIPIERAMELTLERGVGPIE